MNRGTFADQFDASRLERLANLVDLGAQPGQCFVVIEPHRDAPESS